MVQLKLIVAASENLGIGKNGDLPWRLKNEMAYFTRKTTTTTDPNRKNVVIMGRRTWDSVPPKFKPFHKRINFILTRSDLDLNSFKDTHAFGSLEKAIESIESETFRNVVGDVWVIGGSTIYKEALDSPHFYRLYLTKIHKEFDCDTFLPPLPENLRPVSEPDVPKEKQEENGIEYTYHIYEK